MVKGQGFFYSDIGKHARDILHVDFEKRFTIATNPSTGEGAFFASATCEHLPGLKTICSFAYPNIGTSKVEVQCTDDDVGGGVCASMEFTTKPIIKLSSVLANNDFSVGSEISFNTASGRATKSDFGFSFSFTLSHNQIVSLNLCNTNEGDTINISNYDVVCPETNTAVATQLSHCFSRNQSILTVGIQHALNPSTLLKIRGNNNGNLSAVLHHDLMNPRTRLSIFAEINTKVVSKNLKYGLAFSVMP